MWSSLLRYLLVFQGVAVNGNLLEKLQTPNLTKDDEKSIISTILLKSVMSIYAPTSALNGTCKAHSLQYAKGVENFELWALEMFDSSTKLPDGLRMGMIRQLGNFVECVGVTAPDEGDGVFTGQHCYVRLRPTLEGRDQHPGEEPPVGLLDHVGRVVSAYRQHRRAQVKSGLGVSLPEGVAFRGSFCVPSSCSAEEVAAHFSRALGFLGVTAVVGERQCRTRQGPSLAAGDWVVISLLITLVLLAGLSTAYDVFTAHSESRRKLLLAFSLYTNCARLFDVSTTGNETLHALAGIRFLSISWVVYCHAWIMGALFPSASLPFVLEFVEDDSRKYIMNGTVSVDSFFLLSGTLLCYIFLKEMEKGTSFNVPLFYLHRYIRLTPPLVAMILFHVSFADKLGSGPMWTNFEFLSTTCRENWWINLLYVQNYVNYERMCVPQSWYLAVDMQLFLLSPLVLYPLWKWPRVGRVVWGMALLAGLVSSYTAHYFKQTSMTGIQNEPWTHTRTTVWLIGVGLGYLLHHSKNRRPQFSQTVVCVLWTLALLLTVGIVYLPATFSDHSDVGWVDALWVALFRPLFGLGLAIIIFCCARGYGGWVNSFLSLGVFLPLARLSYCIYLTHIAVQLGLLGVMRSPHEFTDSDVIPRFFSDMVISTGFAVILALLIEIPFVNLERAALGRGPTTKKDKGVA